MIVFGQDDAKRGRRVLSGRKGIFYSIVLGSAILFGFQGIKEECSLLPVSPPIFQALHPSLHSRYPK